MKATVSHRFLSMPRDLGRKVVNAIRDYVNGKKSCELSEQERKLLNEEIFREIAKNPQKTHFELEINGRKITCDLVYEFGQIF